MMLLLEGPIEPCLACLWPWPAHAPGCEAVELDADLDADEG